MIDALGQPRSILLLGGTSDIAVAIAERYHTGQPLTVLLAARPSERRDATADGLISRGCTVVPIDLEARDHDSRVRAVDETFAHGDVDVVVVAFGVLGDQEEAWTDAEAAVELAEVNYTAPVHLGVLVSERLRHQAHGTIIALSSVAGERIRRSNFVYGSTKAGFDGFYFGLGEALRGSGVDVVVVRPGFVRSKMTEGLPPAPLAVTPEQVAEAAVSAARQGRPIVWVPALFRWIMLALRHLPQSIFRRLPF